MKRTLFLLAALALLRSAAAENSPPESFLHPRPISAAAFPFSYWKSGATPTATATATASPAATPILWLKADALGLSDNDPVASWTDSSGFGNHAVQATTANKPLFKTAILNGLPIVRFDGSNDFLSIASFSKGVFTMFYVYKATTGGILAEHSANAGSNSGDYHYIPGGAHFAAKGTGGFSAFDLSAPSLSTGTWRIISRAMDGTHAGHLAWVNGVAGTRVTAGGSGNPGTGSVTATYYIGGRAGASLFTAGDIAEIIVYNLVLSTAEREAVEDTLSAKYGITVTH